MAKKNEAAATEEIDSSLIDALEPEAADAPEADPIAAKLEQIAANIERAASLAEAENSEGLAELSKETEALVSSLPSRGRVPGMDSTTWAKYKQESRSAFREAAKAQGAAARKASDAKAAKAVAKAPKAEAVVADYSKIEGVRERVDAAVKLVADGVRLHVKTAQTARQAAETFLAGQRLILTADGLPDLKCTTPEAIQARKDMYEGARAVLAKEGDPQHAKELVEKFRTAVKNQTSDVLVGMVRALDESPEEFDAHYAKIKELRPDLAELKPSEMVFEFYDIPRMSKREIMAERQRNKAAQLKELEAAAQEGDSEAAEKVQEIKATTVQEKVASDVQAAEKSIKAAIAAASKLSGEDREALRAKIAELALLAAQL